MRGTCRAFWVVQGILCCLLFLPNRSWAISQFQIDDFEDGTRDNWTNGAGGQGIVNVVPGGPLGAGDHFIQFSSGSFGGATRLIMFNDNQWLGDYTSASVFQIAMDLKDFNTLASVPVRIAIREAAGTSSTPGYVSTTPFIVPNDGQWHHAIFDLTESAMTPINNPQPFADDIADVDDFRILSSVDPNTIGDAIDGQLGVDNISTFTGIPEPASLTACAGLLCIAGGCLSRRRHTA